MKPFRLDRRTVLRGAGGVAIALPWLEAMDPVKPARAAGSSATRFVAVYTPGGTVLEDFVPTGTTDDFQLSPILAPLEAVKDRLVVFQGLDMQCAAGEQHQSGMVGWLTGCKQDFGIGDEIGPSLDRVLGERLGGAHEYWAIRWATILGGIPHAANVVSYSVENGTFAPQQPAIDPAQIWQRSFGGNVASANAERRKSILDGVLGRYQKLSARLGARDRQLLEQHMERLRDLEQRVGMVCKVPALSDTTGYDPEAFEASDPATDAAIPMVGKLMMDMLVAALACDVTNVATLQWADSSAGYTLPWLNLAGNQVQNFYENNGGYHPAEMTQIFTWYSTQHAYLLSEMAKVDMGGRSLLDESVVFFGSQQQSPASHAKDNMPFLLAGGGGGLQGNRYRNYGSRSHNDLLAAILNLFGDEDMSFGDPQFNTKPLDDLLI